MLARGVLRMVKRPPVVTIMGHVDHGKTTLLDYLRSSKIVEQEFGGITQHIGAFVVPFVRKGRPRELVTFLDTPGHAAFAAMRQRGANLTDIVVLVVACDDGVLEQTVESIKYAKASEASIIVAANKIDKFSNESKLENNIKTIRQQLLVRDVVCEEDGGEVQLVKISAIKGTGIEDLKEAILALAETLEIKAPVDCPVNGRIIESHLDPHRGKLCTILVQEGQLNKNDYILGGVSNWAKVRVMLNERQQVIQSCGPGFPVQVSGWRGDALPRAGEVVIQVESEAEAKRTIAEFERIRLEQKFAADAAEAMRKQEEHNQIYKSLLEEKRSTGKGSMLYRRTLQHRRDGIRQKEHDDMDLHKLNVILKCDVDGSMEAILDLIDAYDPRNKELVKLNLMHHAVGPILESDVQLAASFKNSIIYGFNVKLGSQKILPLAKQAGVKISLFNVIYHLIDDLEIQLNERMPELERDIEIGSAIVLQEFVVDDGKLKVHVAGSKCSRGSLKKDALYRLERDGKIIADMMKVRSLRHVKDDVEEVAANRECGIAFLDNENLEFRGGDKLVAFTREKYKPTIKKFMQPKSL